MKSRKGNILIVIPSIIAIFAFLLAGYFFFQTQQLQKPKIETVVPSPTPVIKDETANWKTYTNEKYGFEVKYNPDLNLVEHDGGKETVGQFTYLWKISFGTNPIKSPNGYEAEVNKKSLSDYRTDIVGHIADKIDSEREITMNGILWTKITYKIFITTDYVSATKAVVSHKNYGYAVTASTLDIDQILGTFRFLD